MHRVGQRKPGLTDTGRAALSQLKRARDDGLNLTAFALPRDLGSGLDPDTIAEAETTIASAVVAYAAQASGSRVPPSHVSGLIFATPSVVDPRAALAETAAAADPARRLAAFNPPQKGYRALRDELKRLENQASPNGGSAFSAPTLTPIRCLTFRKRGLRSERNGPSTLTFIPP